MSFSTAVDALRADALEWARTSEVLDSASTAAGGLGLSSAAMSFASEAACAATYEQVRSKLERLLAWGAGETDAIGSTLLQVRAAYLSADESQAQALRGSWDPK
ncbi:MAG: hypothetical protein IPJ15_09980 [Actinomycetales bacterium]|jgi:hypothetical protein|nr:hypothetical protein [Candidatus Phosphoribacter baldrii]MBK6955982.1 hypothetical protein [Candidatus Phosphoribacter baldrii]MBK7611559.1 hypothetical protein [Candidatus Phosphoribacter baldrii]HRC11470.1 hypothetical protein [Dermatophilaceae bacterium]